VWERVRESESVRVKENEIERDIKKIKVCVLKK
jgi:hypothetical protein